MINIKLFLERKDIPVKIDVVRNTNAIPISFHIADYQIPEGAEARIYLRKPSGAEVYNSAAIEENAVIVQPTTQMYAEDGEAIGQLQIIKDTTVAASFTVVFCIHKNIISDSAIESKDEFGILDTLINQAREEIANAQNATSAANTAAESATAAANAANTGAEAATSAAESATTAADAANAGAEAATSAATSANTAADRANEAAGNIEQANIKPLAYSISGESITANNSAEKPLIGLTVHGRADQGSTTGAQLIPYPYYTSDGTFDGLTAKASNGHIKITGTTTKGANYIIANNFNVPGTYAVKMRGAHEGMALRAYIVDTLELLIEVPPSKNDVISNTLTVPEGKEVRIYFNQGNAGVAVNVDVDIVMTTENKIELAPFEPYTGGTPSPSPEYPQEIDIAGNSGSINVSVVDGSNAQTATIDTPNGLAGLKVSSGGNYTDASGQQWICDEVVRNERGTGKRIQRIGIIESYASETINSAYMSTTGQLTEGATVIYVLDDAIETDLTAEEIADLSALHTYSPTTTISNDAGCDMTAAYVTQYYQGVGDAMFYGVADNLTTEASGTSVLDAHQGKILKGLLDDIWKTIYPVGSIYMSVNNTDPGTLFGGTWEAWGTGRVPVGVDSDDSDFDTTEKTGGKKQVSQFAWIGAVNSQTTALAYAVATPSDEAMNKLLPLYNGYGVTGSTPGSITRLNHATYVTDADGDSTRVLQPYITCYMWKRTA